MTVQSFLRSSFILALSIGVFGQTPKPPVPIGAGGSPTPTLPPRPGSTPTTMPGNTDPSTNPNLIQRPILLVGKVTMDDGTPPPDSVTVQLVCRANPRSIAYTDSKGGFSADLGSRTNSAVMMDATESWNGSMNPGTSRSGSGGGISERDLIGCTVQASLPGFRSDSVNLGSHKSLDNPDIGIIILHRLGNVEGLTISATSRMAPKDAQKAFDKGRNEVRKEKLESGQREFEKAVAVYPKYATAWFELGLVQEELKNQEAARKSYAQALAADSKFVSPLLSLAAMSMREQKWQEAADYSGHLLQLNPLDFPQAWYFNSVANYYLKKMDLAEKSAREGISRDTIHKYAKMNQVLGIVLAQKQDFAGAVEQLRAYLQYAPTAPDADQVKKQIAEVQKFIAPPEAATKQ